VLPDPLHPAVVHFPIALGVLAPAVVAGLVWAIHTGRLPHRAWLAAVGLQILVVASAWVAVDTGHDQHERVERVVDKAVVEEHEEAAETFAWLASATLLIAAAGLIRSRAGDIARVLTLVAACAGMLAVAKVGHSGGELVYHYGAASAYTTGEAATPAASGDHDDD
jgi:uncharacterized membrane protein